MIPTTSKFILSVVLKRRLILTFALSFVLLKSAVATPSVWDLDNDFSTGASTGVNGVWEYGSVLSGSTTYVHFPYFTSNFSSGGSPTGLNTWSSTSGSFTSPSLVQNPGAAYTLAAAAYTFPNHEMALYASSSYLAYVRFTAPSTGKYAVIATWDRTNSTSSATSGILAFEAGNVFENNATFFSGANVHGVTTFNTSGSPFSLTAGQTIDCLIPVNGANVMTGFSEHIDRIVSVTDYGATGNGTTDDTSAIQSAVNSGLSVFFPAGTYYVTSPITVTTSNIEILGLDSSSVIKSDGIVFELQANNIAVRDLKLINKTTPYLLDRFADGQGYQPTVNDPEYSSLTTAQQNEDIGPKIQGFANNLTLTNLTGQFLSLMFWDGSNITVQDCNFRAGKNFAGGILFWKDYSAATCTNNAAIDNTITYASYSGICFAGCYQSIASGNNVSKCGESGIKTWQDDTVSGVVGSCQKMTITGNTSYSVYYDGFDIGCTAARTGTFDTLGTVVEYNTSTYNRHTGFYGDGKNFIIDHNTSQNNQLSGFLLGVTYSTFTYNSTYNNNLSLSPTGQHEAGLYDNCTIQNNTFSRSSSYAGYGLYASHVNTVSGNTYTHCTQFLY